MTWNAGFFSMTLKLEVWFCYCSMSLSVKNLRPTSPQIFVAHTFLIPIKVEHNLINKAICLTHVVYKEFNKCMYSKWKVCSSCKWPYRLFVSLWQPLMWPHCSFHKYLMGTAFVILSSDFTHKVGNFISIYKSSFVWN